MIDVQTLDRVIAGSLIFRKARRCATSQIVHNDGVEVRAGAPCCNAERQQ